MADEAAEFWEEFEKETGEKVVARSIGELYDRPGDVGVWGILILTDKSFRFKYMKSENWFAVLMRGFGTKKPKDEAPPMDIVIPLEGIVSAEIPKRGVIARLFGPAFPRFTLTSLDAEGEKAWIFSTDPSAGIIEGLKKAASQH